MILNRRILYYHWLGLLLIIGLASVIRFSNLSKNSLWTDEFLSLECSSGWGRTDLSLAGRSIAAPDLISLSNARPWYSIWTSIGLDENHPPAYFILLRCWRATFGDSPVSIRGLSVVASLVAIVLLFAIGVNIHSPRAALWACLLMALALPQVQQAQDARAYMPVTAACLAAVLALIRIDRFGPTSLRCATLFLGSLLAPLMHYMAFASLAAMLIYAIIFMRGEARKWVLISLGSCLAFYALLWGPQMLQQHYRMMDDTAWLVDAGSDHTKLILQQVCSLPARLFLDLDLAKTPTAWLSVTAFVLPIVLCIGNRSEYRRVYLCWIWFLVPVLTALLIDLATGRSSLSMIRYTLAAGPGLYLILGLLAAAFPKTGWIPAATIAASCALCMPSAYESRFPDYREVSRFVACSSSPSDPVVLANARPVLYCNESLLSLSYYLQSQPRPIYLLSGPVPRALKVQLKGSKHLCVIADGSRALNMPMVPGLKIDRADVLVDMAIAGTADPVSQSVRHAAVQMETDPSLKLALGIR